MPYCDKTQLSDHILHPLEEIPSIVTTTDLSFPGYPSSVQHGVQHMAQETNAVRTPNLAVYTPSSFTRTCYLELFQCTFTRRFCTGVAVALPCKTWTGVARPG